MLHGRSKALLYVTIRRAARELGISEEELRTRLREIGLGNAKRIHVDVLEDIAEAYGLLKTTTDRRADEENDDEVDEWNVPRWMAEAAQKTINQHYSRITALQKEVERLRQELAAARAELIELHKNRRHREA